MVCITIVVLKIYVFNIFAQLKYSRQPCQIFAQLSKYGRQPSPIFAQLKYSRQPCQIFGLQLKYSRLPGQIFALQLKYSCQPCQIFCLVK